MTPQGVPMSIKSLQSAVCIMLSLPGCFLGAPWVLPATNSAHPRTNACLGRRTWRMKSWSWIPNGNNVWICGLSPPDCLNLKDATSISAKMDSKWLWWYVFGPSCRQMSRALVHANLGLEICLRTDGRTVEHELAKTLAERHG